MNNGTSRPTDDLDALLLQIYFHELDDRERIFTRLQLNFGLYATAIAAAAYMSRMMDYSASQVGITLFYVSLGVFTILLAASIYFTATALSGVTYTTFPSATASVTYRNSVQLIHSDTSGAVKPNIASNEVALYISDSIARCTDLNRRVNDFRKAANRRALMLLLYASAPLLVSAVLFIAFDLDASSPRKKTPAEAPTTSSNAAPQQPQSPANKPQGILT